MFSPLEYVSLAELWKEFFQRYRTPLTRIALDEYGQEDYALCDKFGSTDDYCEDAFLASLAAMPVCVANVDGSVMLLQAELDSGRSKLFQKLSTLESNLVARDPKEAGEDNYWLRKFGADHFEPWDISTQKITHWKAKYLGADGALPKKVCFHTLPCSFERGRYVIADEKPPWLDDVIDEHFLPKLIEHFPGWSLCLADKDVKKWRRDVVKNPGSLLSQDAEQHTKAKSGRPELVQLAMLHWQETFPGGLNVPWKLAPGKVLEMTGGQYSESTLRRAVKLLEKSRRS